jgi:ParB family chromosome partitioning protein
MTVKKKEKPKHLGRGLESLLGPITFNGSEDSQTTYPKEAGCNFPSDKELGESLRYLNLNDIKPNPYQPRTTWDEQELLDLSASIKSNGVIQPIIVRPSGTKFEIITGERRFRAAQLASLTSIPALIRKASEEQMLELALVENIHRTGLNPVERAKAYQNYISTFSLTQAEASERLGEDRSVISNHIRLLDLPEEIKQMLIQGQLSMGHARAMLSLPTDELRRKLANRAMTGRLSVREVERLVQKYMVSTGQLQRKVSFKPAHILDLENKLTNQLGTKVIIETRKNGQRGKIIIEFYSLEEFDRITDSMGLVTVEEA